METVSVKRGLVPHINCLLKKITLLLETRLGGKNLVTKKIQRTPLLTRTGPRTWSFSLERSWVGFASPVTLTLHHIGNFILVSFV